MKTTINQKDYDKFYDDIIEFVRNDVKPFRTDVSYCNPPNPFETIIKYTIEWDADHSMINEENRIKSEISLSEREYGLYIDEHFKVAFIRAMINNDEEELIQLKKEIAYAIGNPHVF